MVDGEVVVQQMSPWISLTDPLQIVSGHGFYMFQIVMFYSPLFCCKCAGRLLPLCVCVCVCVCV